MDDTPIIVAPTPEQIAQLNNYNEALKSSGLSAADFASKIKQVAGGIVDFNKITIGAAASFQEMTNFIKLASTDMTGMTTASTAAKAALLTTTVAAFGARKAFEGIAGVDPGNMNLFSGQIDQLAASLTKGGIAGSLAHSSLGGMLSGMKDKLPKGLFEEFSRGAVGATNKAVEFIKKFAEKADNMTRMQAGLFAVSAATGNLSNVYEKAGKGLSNINAVLVKHDDAMRATKVATGAPVEAVEKYYMALGRVPGALEAVVSSGTAAGGNMNMLTAVMKMAAGNGRTVEAVTQDLGAAFKSLGMTGEPALQFVNSFSELSNNLGVELDDIKKGLMGAADAFKNITNAGVDASRMTMNLKDDMNNVVGGLRQFGMTGQHATEVYSGMQKAMSGMTLAQKAYISSQTGGPGGLLGAAEIDKLMMSGDVAGMKKKMMDTLKKQIGPIMDLTDVKDQASAAKFERQKMLMTQGPLGSALGVKDPMDAIRMSAMLKSEQAGGLTTKKLEPEGLQAAINKGTDIEKQTYTELTGANVRLDALNRSTDFIASGLAIANFGIPKGANADLTKLQKSRVEEMSAASKAGGVGAEKLGKDMKDSGVMRDTSNASRGEALAGITNFVKKLGGALSEKLSPLTDDMSKGNNKEVNKTNQDLIKEITALKDAKGATSEQKAYASELDKARVMAMQAYKAAPPSGASGLDEAIAKRAKVGKKDLADKLFEASNAAPPSLDQKEINETLALKPGIPGIKDLDTSKIGSDIGPMPTGKPLEDEAREAAAKGAGAAKRSEAPGASGPLTVSVTENGADSGTKIHVTVKVDKVSENAKSLHNQPSP